MIFNMPSKTDKSYRYTIQIYFNILLIVYKIATIKCKNNLNYIAFN